MNNQYLTKSNMIVSSIIFTIFSYFYYQYSQKNIEHLEQAQLDKELEPPRITSKHIDKYIQKEFSKVIQIFAKEVKNSAKSMSDFNNDFLLKSDYLNFRNSLFTKDIEKQLILVDSRSIRHDADHNTSDYNICLTGIHDINSTNGACNPTGGFGVFKNVIGFRLVKAVIPSSTFVVNKHNNKLKINGVDITLDNRSHNATTLAKHLQTRLGNTFFIIFIDKDLIQIQGSVDFTQFAAFFTDIAALKTYIDNSPAIQEKYVANRFLILFNVDTQFTINTKDNNSAYRLFGFNKYTIANSESSRHSTPLHFFIAPHSPDHSNHFVDVVVKEIPYIACKKNPRGKMVVDRIPITSRQGSIVEYQSPTSEYFSQNYFYPISLDHLSIQLYQDSSEHLYDTQNLDNYFEFEITMMKNTTNFNRVISKQS